jgi:hypothetical protein
LTKELSNVCLQYTTSTGNLASGGLGIWTYLTYKQALQQEQPHQLPLLHSAKDAALDALQSSFEGVDSSMSISDSLFPLSTTATVSTTELQQLQQDHNNNTSISLYTNPIVGCHAMLVVIYYQLWKSQQNDDEDEDYKSQMGYHTKCLLDYIIERLNKTKVDASLWTGKAGAMQAIFFVRQHTNQPFVGQTLVVQLVKQILVEGYYTAKEYHRQKQIISGMSQENPPLLWKTTISDQYDLGCPYGLVGILTTLLGITNEEFELIETVSQYQVDAAVFKNARPYIKQTIDTIPAFGLNTSGNMKMFVSAASSSPTRDIDRHVHWSYGASSYMQLLLSAHHVFSAEEYVEQAQQLAEEVLWTRRLQLTKNGVGLLTGLAGNAYILLRLSQVLNDTNDIENSTVWKQRAEQLARHGIQHWRELLATSTATNSSDQQQSSPYSLMDGLGGLVSLILDMNHPDLANKIQFPLFYEPMKTTTASHHPISTLQERQTTAAKTPMKVKVKKLSISKKNTVIDRDDHKQIVKRSTSQERNTIVPEFISPRPNEKPDAKYLRLQESNVGDEVYYNDGKGGFHNPSLLDEEGHISKVPQTPNWSKKESVNEFETPRHE